jgi:prepilin-type N-terminal cleavage/methylation domain-containing protein
MMKIKTCRGFTLVELAIVLVIIGLIVGSFVGTLSSRIEATHIAETKQGLDDIKTAIFGYVYKNGVLPCPDTDGDGESNACVNSGAVPSVTLGLGSGDAWNNRYEYWIDLDFAVTFDFSTDGDGEIEKRKADGSDTEPLAKSAVAIIFSRGKNGLGATGVDGSVKVALPALGAGHDDEVENGDGNKKFVSRPPTSEGAATAGGEFDDIVIWISEFELKAKMVEAGKLP